MFLNEKYVIVQKKGGEVKDILKTMVMSRIYKLFKEIKS